MVARLGQHRELDTKALSNVVPFSINARRLGMCFSVSAFTSSKARSSVRIKTTFGDLSSFSSLVVAFTEEKQAARVVQASSKSKGKAMARAFLTRMPDLPARFSSFERLPRSTARHPAATGDRGTSTTAVYSART